MIIIIFCYLRINGPIHGEHQKDWKQPQQRLHIFHLRFWKRSPTTDFCPIQPAGRIIPSINRLSLLFQSLANYLQCVCQHTTTWRLDMVLVTAQKKCNNSQKHRHCYDDIAIEEGLLFLNIHNTSESNKWTNIDKPVKPVEESLSCPWTIVLYLVGTKGRYVSFNPSSPNCY